MSCWPAILIAALAVIGGFGVLWDRHHQKNGPNSLCLNPAIHAATGSSSKR